MTLDRTMVAFHLVRGAINGTSGDNVLEVVDSCQKIVNDAQKKADAAFDNLIFKTGGQQNNPNYPLILAIQDDIGRIRKDFTRVMFYQTQEDEKRVSMYMSSILKLYFCIEANDKKLALADVAMSD